MQEILLRVVGHGCATKSGDESPHSKLAKARDYSAVGRVIPQDRAAEADGPTV